MSHLAKVIKSICDDSRRIQALDWMLTNTRGLYTYNQMAHKFGLATKRGVNLDAWPEWEELMSAVDAQDSELRQWVPGPAGTWAHESRTSNDASIAQWVSGNIRVGGYAETCRGIESTIKGAIALDERDECELEENLNACGDDPHGD
jgi:hypothetical protein